MTFGRWSGLAALARRRGVLIVFILLVASMFATTSTFGTYQNLINVLQQNSIIGIIACGMTFAIILGGFDLSVGSMTALASVVGATLMIDLGTPGIPIGIVGAVAHGLLYLLVIGIVLLVADLAFFGTRFTRRERAQR